MADEKGSNATTMLLAFRAENVRSFRDPLEFSLFATSLAEEGVPREIPWREGGRTFVRVLPVAAVFGANASGKTNLLRAMDDMRRLVDQSFRKGSRAEHHQNYLRRVRRPFRLDPECEKAPSSFEIDVVINGIRYEYGFKIDDSYVISEWAFHYPKGRAARIFQRDETELIVGETRSHSKARVLQELFRADALVLSVAAAAQYSELRPLYEWFDNNLLLAAASSRESRWAYTARLMTDKERSRQAIELLQIADLGITGARPLNPEPEEVERMQTVLKMVSESLKKAFPKDTPEGVEPPEFDVDTVVGILLSHRGTRGSVEFDSSDESLGTLVWLGLVGPVLDSLARGTVLLADELESSLHPSLVVQLVNMFQSPRSNPNGAQLIFNSHEARLLGNSQDDRVIGRDQAWFTEKLHDGSTRLYPLAALSPRKSEAIAKRYMQGRYGATPLISSAEFSALAATIAGDGSGS
ncbi:AAA family ATPase [Mycobacterium kansasii]